ncbi:hypothetical protein [Photobacterium leiognathi]|uniref:hypothetical protein n=1 Tax=Photobacterium leiognathi TaxID=553611 RepID=UPI002982040D|nr:hypothetical protein [Photobacterium leiognathi]
MIKFVSSIIALNLVSLIFIVYQVLTTISESKPECVNTNCARVIKVYPHSTDGRIESNPSWWNENLEKSTINKKFENKHPGIEFSINKYLRLPNTIHKNVLCEIESREKKWIAKECFGSEVAKRSLSMALKKISTPNRFGLGDGKLYVILKKRD